MPLSTIWFCYAKKVEMLFEIEQIYGFAICLQLHYLVEKSKFIVSVQISIHILSENGLFTSI